VLDDLLLERHPYTVSQANSSSGDHEADKTYVKLATLKSVALLALRNVYRWPRTRFTFTCGIFFLELEVTNLTCSPA